MSNNPELSQSDIDEAVLEAREGWEKMVAESGVGQTLFIAQRGDATEYLARYETMREVILEQGYDMPPLVKGVKVTFHD